MESLRTRRLRALSCARWSANDNGTDLPANVSRLPVAPHIAPRVPANDPRPLAKVLEFKRPALPAAQVLPGLAAFRDVRALPLLTVFLPVDVYEVLKTHIGDSPDAGLVYAAMSADLVWTLAERYAGRKLGGRGSDSPMTASLMLISSLCGIKVND